MILLQRYGLEIYTKLLLKLLCHLADNYWFVIYKFIVRQLFYKLRLYINTKNNPAGSTFAACQQ